MKKLALLLTLVVISVQQWSLAAVEIFSERLEGSSWTSLDVYDNKFLDMYYNASWQNAYTNKTVTNKIQLGINPDVPQTGTYLSGSVEIEVQYEYWDNMSSSFLWSTPETRTLSVSHDGTNYLNTIEDLSTYVFSDGHHVKVSITNVTGLALSDLYLEAIIEVERYYDFDGNAVANASKTTGIQTGYIEFNWDHKMGAEFYELEWVHINDYKLENGQYYAMNELSYNYYLNSTRISIKDNFYKIPLIFDHGYLIFRVRAVGKQGTNFEYNYYGDWTAAESGLISSHPVQQIYHVTTEYDPDMNWSHQVGYTEDGKRMEGVSFADGLGRSRQSISHNTETEQAIVSNVYYDELGRPVISDLPTPVDGEQLKHYPDFNRANVSGDPSFNNNYFDAVTGDVCNPPQTQTFSSSYGAGNYYSSNNSDDDSENALIPDAEGYPYTRIYYRNDYTGRLDRVTGAGGDLHLGAGHETRYIYVSPDMHELNSMFGTQVGDFKHYTKMITVDANGQTYVQYTDMAGRVISSYLTGPSPSNLDAFPESIGTVATHPLIEQGQVADLDANSPTTTFEQTVYFPYDNETYVFDYALTPQNYTSSCLAGSICFDCVYDLELSVIDECGEVKWESTETLEGATFDAICSSDIELTYSEEVTLPKGVYTIRKKLSVNQDAIAAYWCIYSDNEICTTPLSDFFNNYYANEPFDACNPVESYLDEPSMGRCDAYRQAMLIDVSPGGQYARYTNTNGTISTTDVLSIFYDPAGAPLPHYKTVTYLDENSNAITVVNNAGATVSPAALSPLEFLDKFDESWAPSLLEWHQEYCYLEFCDDNISSHAYDQNMLDEYTYSGACTGGYLSPLGTTPNIQPFSSSGCAPYSKDPFFDTGGLGVSKATNMANQMSTFRTLGSSSYSMWEWAIIMAFCPEVNTESAANTCLTANGGYWEGACPANDLVWVNFRELYLTTKMTYYYELQQANAVTNNCDNECLGSAAVGCEIYADKVSRFGNIETLFGSDVIANPNDLVTLANTESAAGCQSICENYADDWIDALSGCDFSGLTQTQLDDMRDDMIELCAYGCDLNHPLGATTTPTGQTTSGGFATIDDILAFYLGSGYEDNLCTELLISSPGVYQDLTTFTDPFIQPIDNCACDAIYQAKYDLLNNNPLGFSSIEQMLAFNTGVSMSDVDYLLCTCDDGLTEDPEAGSWTPGYTWNSTQTTALANSGIVVSAALTCSPEPCEISCTEITDDLNYLYNRFSGVTALHLTNEYPDIVENYMNNKYNYHLSYTDYMNFYSGCQASSIDPYCVLADEAKDLTKVLTLLTYRGQLLNTSSNPVDLDADNIVYQMSELNNFFGSDLYYSAQSGDNLTLYLDNGACNIALSGWSGIDYEKLVSFDVLIPTNANCTSANTFKVLVSYLDCGRIAQGELTGTSSCFEVSECVCGDNGQLLCDDWTFPEDLCYEPYLSEMYQNAMTDWQNDIEGIYDDFAADYNEVCNAIFDTEKFSYTGREGNYQYTLFFYDQAGNLAKTVAPMGFHDAFINGTSNAAINSARAAVDGFGTTEPAIIPSNDFETTYAYNSYNQLVKTTNPDQEGDTEFWYDLYGRIVLSQNPVQADQNKYSYSKYDAYGRPVEVGQTQTAATLPYFEYDDLGATINAWIDAGSLTEVTITTYDEPLSSAISAKFKAGTQQNLRLRVASVAYFPVMNGGIDPTEDYETALHYSYDIHGNVFETLQDVPMLAPVDQDIKSTQYEFELISGNVQKVKYQEDALDYMAHSYTYDKLNRLQEVHTSTDDVHQTKEIRYEFFDYGPLARVEIGKNQVQGFDYFYTINGWMKGMNGSVLTTSNDLGSDGTAGYSAENDAIHTRFATDAAAWTLGYFDGDYTTISGAVAEATYAGSNFDAQAPDLYNGNIRHAVTSIYGMNTLGAAYTYDQLNRLTEMTAFENTTGVNSWSGISATTDYYNNYSYDRNGNITNLQRNATSTLGLYMDNFAYHYTNIGSDPSNRLDKVDDGGTNDGVGGDILSGMGAGNYDYNKIGQLLSDVQEGIGEMTWRLGDKKLKKIERDDQDSPEVEFVYSPLGLRVLKIERPRVAGSLVPEEQWKYTYYAYDANGQVMATYDVIMSAANNVATWSESNIYGASRIGQVQKDVLVWDNGAITASSSEIYQNNVGNRRYEVTNHLGNVLAVVTDRHEWNTADSWYEPVVVMTSDYYPYGMVMPGRNTSTESYRYAYNGMEQDNEVSGNGNSYTTEFRQYDPRLGRWKSQDPLKYDYPWASPYSAFNNNPVFYKDPLGLESESEAGPGRRRKKNKSNFFRRERHQKRITNQRWLWGTKVKSKGGDKDEKKKKDSDSEDETPSDESCCKLKITFEWKHWEINWTRKKKHLVVAESNQIAVDPYSSTVERSLNTYSQKIWITWDTWGTLHDNPADWPDKGNPDLNGNKAWFLNENRSRRIAPLISLFGVVRGFVGVKLPSLPHFGIRMKAQGRITIRVSGSAHRHNGNQDWFGYAILINEPIIRQRGIRIPIPIIHIFRDCDCEEGIKEDDEDDGG